MDNEKKTLQFPHFAVGASIPVYAINMGLRRDRAMYLVKESKNAWICLNYNGKPHCKFLSNKTDPLSDVLLKLATEADEFLVPN